MAVSGAPSTGGTGATRATGNGGSTATGRGTVASPATVPAVSSATCVVELPSGTVVDGSTVDTAAVEGATSVVDEAPGSTWPSAGEARARVARATVATPAATTRLDRDGRAGL